MNETLSMQQQRMTNFLRDPLHCSPPSGIEQRRLKIYRDLFLTNIENLLSGNFPVIQRLLGQSCWRDLIHDFYRDHRSQTPLFTRIACEFISYLETRDLPNEYPWLRELAHYEWIELALQISDAAGTNDDHTSDGDLLTGRPLVSPLAWPLAYVWPVHRISDTYRPIDVPAQPSFLLVQRDDSGHVHFNEINALTYRLLQRLEQSPELTGREQLLALAEEANVPDIGPFIANGRILLEQLRQSRIVLGTLF